MRDAYMRMHLALVASGLPIVYSLCQYGMDNVWEWGPQVGATLWRTTGDIAPNYDRMSLIGSCRAAWKDMPATVTGTIPTCSK
jgi:alpha-galactosidase